MAKQKTESPERPRFERFGHFGAISEPFREIVGPTLTIPGQARSLAALINANAVSGAPFPLHRGGEYDEDMQHALARAEFDALSEEEQYELYEEAVSANRHHAAPAEKPSAPSLDTPQPED